METEKAKEILEELLKGMEIDAGISAKEIEDYISLEITTPDSALVIGRQGKTLGALQYLVNLIINIIIWALIIGIILYAFKKSK